MASIWTGTQTKRLKHKSTCFEFTSWSSLGLSLITFHCNCNKALCLSSCNIPQKILIIKLWDEINLLYQVFHTLDFWRCNSSSSFRHSSSSSHLNALIWASWSFLINIVFYIKVSIGEEFCIQILALPKVCGCVAVSHLSQFIFSLQLGTL